MRATAGRRAARARNGLTRPWKRRCRRRVRTAAGSVEVTHVASQYQEEIPEVRPIVRRFDIEVGRCSQCRRRVQGRHALQTSGALAARGETPRSTESGEAPAWQGATREHIGQYSTEEQRSPRGMHRRSNAAGLLPRAATGRLHGGPSRAAGCRAYSVLGLAVTPVSRHLDRSRPLVIGRRSSRS